MWSVSELAKVDRRYRCVMKLPKKKQMLRSIPYILCFWYGTMDGIVAVWQAIAFRRAGGVARGFRREVVWDPF